jgi:hypothetical protein
MADLYETDILAWSEQQGEALRELISRRDLPNALDLAHVVEEIEDVGLTELNAVRSFIRHILSHLMKCAIDPDALSVRHWHAEIGNWQSELTQRLTPSMRQRVDLGALWEKAARHARLDLRARDVRLTAEVAALLGHQACPYSIDDLMTGEPDLLASRLSLGPG